MTIQTINTENQSQYHSVTSIIMLIFILLDGLKAGVWFPEIKNLLARRFVRVNVVISLENPVRCCSGFLL